MNERESRRHPRGRRNEDGCADPSGGPRRRSGDGVAGASPSACTPRRSGPGHRGGVTHLEIAEAALDLIARALKAGHAFATGLKMAADELEEPVGPEFRKTFEEQNFGLPLKDALDNLTHRIPLLDVRFFATAVLIQRETGGNLAEILDNLAYVVRERFKVLRQVRVYTAHGRFTSYVLIALLALVCVGTLGFHFIEGWPWLDSLYMVVTTLATVETAYRLPAVRPTRVPRSFRPHEVLFISG